MSINLWSVVESCGFYFLEIFTHGRLVGGRTRETCRQSVEIQPPKVSS